MFVNGGFFSLVRTSKLKRRIEMEEHVVEKEVTMKPKYVTPRMESHEPLKVVQGSDDDCNGLYYTSLYYW